MELFSVPKKQQLVHVLLVSFPAQGHVNPLLRLGTLLASKGLLVTFSAPQHIRKSMLKANKHIDQVSEVGEGMIRFEFFDDGLTEDDPIRQHIDAYMSHLELSGPKALTHMIQKHEKNGHRVACVINNPFIPWVLDVAKTLNIPSAMLWVHACATFSAYYHYHHNLVPFPTESDPKIDVQLPCMPLLKYDEIPSFLLPTNPPFLRKPMLGQFKKMSQPFFCILMETFQELENEVIKYMSDLCPIKPVGPLFMNPTTTPTSSNTIRGDLIETEDDCIEWLDSKDTRSVVYICFGTVIDLKQEQADEIAIGVLNSGVCFLWALMQPPKGSGRAPIVLPDGFLEKVGDKGKVVHWCPQDKVLSHRAVACTVSHCGWNSSMEALSCGVPVVAFPSWGDQVINAKYFVDVYGVGIRLSRGEAANKIVSREEVEECLREATGGGIKAVGMRENALRWKKAAEEAVADGGSSARYLQSFVDEVKRRSSDKC